MIKYHPILFSAPMIRAVLRDVDPKTQTRRVIKPQPNMIRWSPVQLNRYDGWEDEHGRPYPCPYGQPGDRLYVKEAAWIFCEKRPNGTTKTGRPKWHYAPLRMAPVFYVADGGGKPTIPVEHPETRNEWCWKYKTARFMPRWASRIALEITDIRVQRLQEISIQDAQAEGVNCPVELDSPCIRCGTCADSDLTAPIRAQCNPRSAFASLWQSINAKRAGCSWDDNPFVWAVSFRRVQP